jgi:hypothetical protein
VGFGSTHTELLMYHHRLLFGTDPTGEITARFDSIGDRQLVIALLSSPEYQLD